MEKCEYVGNIPELKGQDATIRPIEDSDEAKWIVKLDRTRYVMVTFEDHDIQFNGDRVGRGWYPFPKSHFRALNSRDKKRVF